MSNEIPSIRLIDRFNNYFPKVVAQNKTTLGGTADILKADGKKGAIAFLYLHLFTLQLQVPGYILYNIGQVFYKAMELSIVIPQTPFSNTSRQRFIKTTLRLVDYSMATAVSPLIPFGRIIRCVIGILKPSTFVRDQPLLLNDRLDSLCVKWKTVEVTDRDNPDTKLACESFLSTLFAYASRWGTVSSRQVFWFSLFGTHSINFYRNRHFIGKFTDDKVQEKCRLIFAFNDYGSDPDKVHSPEDVLKFVKANFTTPRQKALVRMFIKKQYIAGYLNDRLVSEKGYDKLSKQTETIVKLLRDNFPK